MSSRLTPSSFSALPSTRSDSPIEYTSSQVTLGRWQAITYEQACCIEEVDAELQRTLDEGFTLLLVQYPRSPLHKARVDSAAFAISACLGAAVAHAAERDPRHLQTSLAQSLVRHLLRLSGRSGRKRGCSRGCLRSKHSVSMQWPGPEALDHDNEIVKVLRCERMSTARGRHNRSFGANLAEQNAATFQDNHTLLANE